VASEDKLRAEKVAEQFESIFLDMVMKSMRATVPEGSLMGEGLGGKIYLEMLDQQFVKSSRTLVDPEIHEALVRELMEPLVVDPDRNLGDEE
jgi:flagellar protein FlgJ